MQHHRSEPGNPITMKRCSLLLAIAITLTSTAFAHDHISEGGMMKMRPVEAVVIMPGEPSVMQLGGLHIILMGLTVPLVEGHSFPLTLAFERADSIGGRSLFSRPKERAPAT